MNALISKARKLAARANGIPQGWRFTAIGCLDMGRRDLLIPSPNLVGDRISVTIPVDQDTSRAAIFRSMSLAAAAPEMADLLRQMADALERKAEDSAEDTLGRARSAGIFGS